MKPYRCKWGTLHADGGGCTHCERERLRQLAIDLALILPGAPGAGDCSRWMRTIADARELLGSDMPEIDERTTYRALIADVDRLEGVVARLEYELSRRAAERPLDGEVPK